MLNEALDEIAILAINGKNSSSMSITSLIFFVFQPVSVDYKLRHFAA